MKKYLAIPSLLLCSILFSGCNLYGGLSSPSNDQQLLSAARAAMDQGDYAKAASYYQQLSNTYSDQKISELTFNTLAGNNIFTIADLVGSLGSGNGGVSTITNIAQLLAGRGKTDGTTRVAIQGTYVSNAGIVNADLKNFMQLFSAVAMIEEELANAVGSDGVLTASDLVVNPAACKGDTIVTSLADANCNIPGTNTLNDTATGDGTITLSATANWSDNPSLTKIKVAAVAAGSAAAALGNSSGLLSTLSTLSSIPAVSNSTTARAARWFLLTTLFP